MPSIFIDRDKVVSKLIKERCKLSDKQSKLDQKNEFIQRADLKYHRKFSGNKFLQCDIYQMFPPRRLWCHIGTRKNRSNLSSERRNQLNLKYTYLRAKHKKCNEEWYVKLCEYADRVVRIADEMCSSIPPPKVIVLEKSRKKGKCKGKDIEKIIYRPVCQFKLEFKIIFSLLNQFLTRAFDSFFYPCSYAFRLPQKGETQLPHLKTVQAIQHYRKEHLDQPLYVAECDMQKFYDTINHDVIKTRFSILLHHYAKENKLSQQDFKLVKKWFFIYIDCFDFRNNVFLYNKKSPSDSFWKHNKMENGNPNICRQIEWVQHLEYITRNQKKSQNTVGVPQGGALSGLVANIVMHFVDNRVLKAIDNQDVLYCRFCDDMVLIGTSREKVSNVFVEYQNAILDSKLFSHPTENLKINHMREFWKGKTRGPYEWGEKGKNTYPWITFVGFDINWCGNLRIRQASFKKHINKQYSVMNDLIRPYFYGYKPRYCRGSILNSLANRLICMSVGRVSIRNYYNHKNTCSWMSAFSILDKNKWSSIQLKELDNHRRIIYRRAVKQMGKIECPVVVKDKISSDESDKYLFYGSPFSYYGQCFIYKEKKCSLDECKK